MSYGTILTLSTYAQEEEEKEGREKFRRESLFPTLETREKESRRPPAIRPKLNRPIKKEPKLVRTRNAN